MDASVGTRPRRLYAVGTGLSLAGAALLVAAAFLPESSRVEAPLSDAARAGTLWTDGLGLMMVLAGALVGTITLRPSPRSAAWCWASLWVGLLALGNAIALAATEAFRPIELGIAGLGVAGLALLAGAAAGFACTGPVIPGLGTWRSLHDALGRPLATPAESARRPRLGLVSRGLGALGLYGALSVVLWGLPLAPEFGSALIAENSIDPSVYTWFYGWWPHAIVSGLNPFLTDAIFAPDGYNLTWVTAVPGPSVLMAPVTLALGPVATYNLLALAAPPLAAWSAFLLSRHVAGAVGPAIVAGFVFGFSPYMLRMLQGSPHLYFVALVPLAVLLVLKRLDGSIGERPFVVAITLGVAAQFLTSNDVLATMSIFGALALLAAFVLYVERRPALLRTAALIAAGYVGGGRAGQSGALLHALRRAHNARAEHALLRQRPGVVVPAGLVDAGCREPCGRRHEPELRRARLLRDTAAPAGGGLDLGEPRPPVHAPVGFLLPGPGRGRPRPPPHRGRRDHSPRPSLGRGRQLSWSGVAGATAVSVVRVPGRILDRSAVARGGDRVEALGRGSRARGVHAPLGRRRLLEDRPRHAGVLHQRRIAATSRRGRSRAGDPDHRGQHALAGGGRLRVRSWRAVAWAPFQRAIPTIPSSARSSRAATCLPTTSSSCNASSRRRA